ncbi:MAG TPA: RNA methyltransferase [Candidatus Hydrogenedentes bacterium]|nr:RNA methyltransferase [Candidatus Hydrogenedentota bacterium]
MAERSLCPQTEPFRIRGEPFSASEILCVLEEYISEERKQRIREVVAQRTYSVVPVLEGLYDFGNVNAVLRSAEAMGCQAAHVIDLVTKFKKANRVSKGAEKWLDIRRWNATVPCVTHLRAMGYRIIATHLQGGRPIAEIAFDAPSAVFFGNEHDGVSQTLAGMADELVRLPIIGFTESYNISVAAAITLYHIYRDRMARLGSHGDLTRDEMVRLMAVYYRRSVDAADEILLRSRRGR